jgi:hypothetical protein
MAVVLLLAVVSAVACAYATACLLGPWRRASAVVKARVCNDQGQLTYRLARLEGNITASCLMNSSIYFDDKPHCELGGLAVGSNLSAWWRPTKPKKCVDSFQTPAERVMLHVLVVSTVASVVCCVYKARGATEIPLTQESPAGYGTL